jgi:hypothetical protein
MPVFRILWELAWKLGLLVLIGWILTAAFALGVGSLVVNMHQANAPDDRVIEYIDCDKYAPMMRDQRCKPK